MSFNNGRTRRALRPTVTPSKKNRLKVPWASVTYAGGITIGIVLLFALLALIGLVILGFWVWVILINVHDIQTVGVNFWNVFWIVLAGLGILGTLRSGGRS